MSRSSEPYLRGTSKIKDTTNPEEFFKKAEEKTFTFFGLMTTDQWETTSNLVLLVILYMIQGVPVGLSVGSIPFLLQQTVSYTGLGIFSIVTYPYSLKLLWAPIVDTIYSPLIGKRKSWIIPMQLLSGFLMLFISWNIESYISTANSNSSIWNLSIPFFFLILFTATQDIAVDGWAITLLSKENNKYAATCQTVGLNIGYFCSFTVFLALNSPEFCNSYLRSVPQAGGLFELSSYMRFWSIFYIVFTGFLFFIKQESITDFEFTGTIRSAYTQTIELLRRSYVRDLVIVLLLAKIGFIAAENITALELIQRGFKKEDLALFVLIDFPLQLIVAVFAGRFTSGKNPFDTWLLAYQVRLGICAFASVLLLIFPASDSLPFWYYILIITYSLLSSSASTFMFVAMGAFFNFVSDTSMGGTYLTLFNTFSNLGGVWPKFFVYFFVDFFSIAHCETEGGVTIAGIDCVTKSGQAACATDGGMCVNDVEGFYIVNTLSVGIGFILFWTIRKKLVEIQNFTPEHWRLCGESPSRASVIESV